MVAIRGHHGDKLQQMNLIALQLLTNINLAAVIPRRKYIYLFHILMGKEQRIENDRIQPTANEIYTLPAYSATAPSSLDALDRLIPLVLMIDWIWID